MHLSLALLVLLFSLILSNVINRIFPRLPLPCLLYTSIDLVKAVFKDSDKYEVKFVTTPFDSILTGVDSGRYQIAANDFNYNEERAQKYSFSDPISRSNYAIISAEGTKYTSLDDLSGKTTEVLPGTNYAQDVYKRQG